MESPANNNVVIKRHKKRNQDCTEPNTFKRILTVKKRLNRRISTFEYRTDSPDRDGALPVELAEYELHEEEGEGPEPQHHGVGDQEGAAPILVSRKGKPPDIAKT